jgi:hypothetical protein
MARCIFTKVSKNQKKDLRSSDPTQNQFVHYVDIQSFRG